MAPGTKIGITTRALLVALALPAGPVAGTDRAPSDAAGQVRPQALQAHIRFLADDRLEGRGTGTRGHEVAALYVATQFEALGLEPAGEAGSYYQSVPLRSFRIEPRHCRLSWRGPRGRSRLEYDRDYVVHPSFTKERQVLRAPMVFVGYGVTAPELGQDDYAGLDVRGKVVVLMFGAPRRFPSDPRAHYSQQLQKHINAAAHGAVGTLTLRSEQSEAVLPWPRLVTFARRPYLRWIDAAGHPADVLPSLRGHASLSTEAGAGLLASSGHSPAAVQAAAERPDFRGFDMGLEVEIVTRMHTTDLRSPNVVALRRGSDPRLTAQTVVFSAHLDHLGRGASEQGDEIYNGAYDNASGMAGLLEIARLFAAAPPPRRSVLFLAATAEERGMLGSDYFVRHPTVTPLVANVNLDIIAMLGPFHDLVAFGSEHSSLGEEVRHAAQAVGLELAPDPWPEQALFVRSDHYSFVRQGIPAVFLTAGMRGRGPQLALDALQHEWLKHVYHTPRDDSSQSFDLEAGARLVQAAYLVGRAVAEKDQTPRWNAGDFFGQIFGPRTPRALPAAP